MFAWGGAFALSGVHDTDGRPRNPTRRGFLIGGGATLGLIVAAAVWPRETPINLSVAEDETLLSGWLKIGADGQVVVAIPRRRWGRASTPRSPCWSRRRWARTGRWSPSSRHRATRCTPTAQSAWTA
ncbi:hypothetical protein [Hankyongella ginsenosidimutans]|uniref:hypothetical protein n=1 Tax=Hankyongella ginsenosidimutans TaxID=1763828 RepID=UPI001CA34633|nr:hypothetical protein [Hankyongella ginsenosidimutans]